MFYIKIEFLFLFIFYRLIKTYFFYLQLKIVET